MFLVFAVVCLSGCSEWSREMRVEESAYQVLSAVDTIQTVQVTRRPDCYQESDPVTNFVIGNHPRAGAVIAWGVARAGLHAFVTDWMQREDAAPWAKRTWQALTIGYEARDVGQNWSIGLHFGAPRVPDYAPCLK